MPSTPPQLSANAKEAIKVGLAIVITYGLALRFAWMSPTWAAIAVAFISQPGEGQSLYKGMLRAVGTFVAFFWGLFLLALFPQDRWLLLIATSPVLGYFTYRMKGQNDYLWFVAGFVTPMIIMAGPSAPGHAFEFASYRTLETLIGIGVWALISTFIWPVTNLGTLKSATDKLLATQQKVLEGCHQAVIGNSPANPLPSLQSQEAQLVTQVGSLIDVVAAETYEVRGVRNSWKRLHTGALSFMQASNRLQFGARDLQQVAMQAVLPGLGEFFSELDARLAEAQSLLVGKPPARQCQQVSLEVTTNALDGLDHFQKAAVLAAKIELESLDTHTRSTVECFQEIKGHETPESNASVASARGKIRGPLGFKPIDRDQLTAAVVVVISMWAGFRSWVYINPPGHVSWFQFIPNLMLAVMRGPQMRFFPLKGFAYAYLVGMAVYVFIMPQLSGFAELGLLLFAFSFITVYYFPHATPAFFLAMFTMFGISNQQTYDVASMMNMYLFTMGGILLVYALSYLVGSPRQEKTFLRMAARFFRSCEYLTSHWADPTSLLGRMKEAYHRREVQTVPQKMALWGDQIDAKRFPKNSPEQVTKLVASLQVIAYRIEDLIQLRGAQQADLAVREIGDDMRQWREVVDAAFRQWSEVPEADPGHDLRERVSDRLAKLNDRIQQLVEHARPGEVGDAETRSFYQLLGTYRGLTEAGVAYAGVARKIDWAEWREERFE
ncbi:MAG: FUSC family protein [Deltaproteobacteria bacterium]|nr:FUSC family protein [Deltaproteobacteria bacterium]